MKRKLVLTAAMCTMALTGCGPSASEVKAPPMSESTAAATTEAKIVISEEATCALLVGPNEDGPLIRYVNGISSADPADTSSIQDLRDNRTEVNAIGERSTPELQLLITTLFSEDVNDFKAAGAELLTRCG